MSDEESMSDDGDAEEDAVVYFIEKLEDKRGQLPIRSLESHRRHADEAIRECVGYGWEFRDWLLDNPQAFNVNGNVVRTTQLGKLYDKAASFVSGNKKTVDFYRVKPEEYFDDVECNGGEMEPYQKDYNGSPGCPINGKLDGLFFSANANPPDFSYFGNKRLQVDADYMLTSDCNIYFADFYCHYEKDHYITVVVTNPETLIDEFCAETLVKMNIYNNPFLEINGEIVQAIATRRTHVEVFWTESVDVREIIDCGYGDFDYVEPRGRGQSKEDGIPKNSDCPICNV